MAVLQGINGVVRNLVSATFSIGGVVKKAKAGYVGVGGGRQQFLTGDLLVTRAVLNQGAFVNCTPTYLTNQQSGTDGFQITGRANNSWNGSYYYNWSSWLRWDIQLDLTNYKTIKWYGKKITNHGLVGVYVTDGLKYHPDAGMGNQTTVYAQYAGWYDSLPTSWTEYSLNVSHITGVHTISFVGGFVDPSGSSSSSSAFCNIRFLT